MHAKTCRLRRTPIPRWFHVHVVLGKKETEDVRHGCLEYEDYRDALGYLSLR